MAGFATTAVRMWNVCKGFVALLTSLLKLILLLMSLLRFVVSLALGLSIGLAIVFLVIFSINNLWNSDQSKCRGDSASSQCDEQRGEAEASSSCSNATPSADSPYDVFINHRGSDVKKTLASIIYRWLGDKGLRVFLDQEEMEVGKGLRRTIKHAIRRASVHIAIFSKRYAESRWCLDELCLMLKTGDKIIPVYFDVEPSDLRWIGKRKSVYSEAFAKHQNNGRHDPQKVNKWKWALHVISYQHGLELNGPKFNSDWGRLLQSIVDAVFEARVRRVDLDVAAVPVGLDEAIQDFEDFIGCPHQHSETKKPRIVGIVGLGGSGKTTLAMEFYNRRRRSFNCNCCSFLVDVRHAAARNALVSLQSQLLKDLVPNDRSTIHSLAQGRGILRNRLAASSPRVLLILDDIDHEGQFEELLGRNTFGTGSLIIITSRDKSALLKLMPESAVYKMKPLNDNHAEKLFCSYAFQNPHPVTGFQDLVKNILKKCQGLPLFLKVMGAQLHAYGKNNKEYWEQELRNIAKIPPNGLKQILQVSYDKLDSEEKQIFLDIACFFVGEDRNLAIRVWDGSMRTASSHLKSLEYKCLVEFDDRDRIKMHDILRDLGREIASRESSYLFCHPDHLAVNVQRRQQLGRTQVRGILAATSDNTDEYRLVQKSHQPPSEEIELSALKLLIIEGNHLGSRFGKQLINLVWLRWHDCPHTRIPPWLPMENLTVLHLVSGIFQEWQLCDHQLPLQLRGLKIQCTQLSKISIPEDICPELEHVDLCNNENLTEVQHLPTKLVKLNLNGCIVLKRIWSLNLRNLQELDIGGCSELEDQLPSLEHLISLKRLRAGFCRKLPSIKGLEHLENLQTLDIRGCSELNTLPNLQRLRSLEKIKAYGCNKLQEIQGLEPLSKLQRLGISYCSELQKLPDLTRLSSLKKLKADGCVKLHSIQGLDQLQHLTNLSLPANLDTATWDSLQQLKRLPSEMNLNRTMSGFKSFSFSDLPVIDFKISEDEDNYYAFCNTLEITASPNNSWRAVVLLFAKRPSREVSAEQQIHANVSPRENGYEDWNDTDIRFRKGDWIDISVYSQDSSIVKNLNRKNSTTEFTLVKDKRNAKAVVKGWMMMVSEGKEGMIFEVLSKLFKHDTPLKQKRRGSLLNEVVCR